MKNMKKWLSVLLAVVMLATTLCMPVFAADATSDETVAGTYVYNFLNGDISGTSAQMNFYDYAQMKWSGASGMYASGDQTVTYSGEDTYVTQIKLKELTLDGTAVAIATQFNAFCNWRFYNIENGASDSKNGFVPISAVGDGKTFGDRGTTLGLNIREQSYVSSTYGIFVTVTWEQNYTDATGFVDTLLTVTYQPLPGYTYTETTATYGGDTTDADGNGIYDELDNGYLSVFSEGEKGEYEPLMFQVGTDSDYATSSITNGMCYVFRLTDGTFVIYDGGGWGGTTYDNTHNITIANRLLAVLNEYNELDEITISAWVLTHPHNDHMQAFGNIVTRIANSEITNVKIERIIANIPDFTEQTAYSTSFDWTNWEFDVDAKTDAETLMAYHNLFDTMTAVQGTYVYKAHVGQKYFLADASIEILYTHDVHEGKIPNGAGQDTNDQGDKNDINGISIISRVTMWENGDTVMMTGDASYRGIDWINAAYGDSLASTYVQAPHHGHPSCFLQHNAYDGVDHLECERKFYSNVAADYLLWPCGKDRFRELNVDEDEEGVDNGISYSYLTAEEAASGNYSYVEEHTYDTDGVTILSTKYKRTGVDVPTREYARQIGMDNTYVALCITTMFDFFDDNGTQLSEHEVTYLLRTQKDLKEGMPVADGNYKLIADIVINQDIDHTGETMTDSDSDGTDDTYVSDGALTTRLIRQSYSTDDANNSGINFTGTLDGDGHSIIFAEGMSFNSNDRTGILFGTLNSGTVKNLGIGTEANPVKLNVQSSGANTGVLAAYVLAGSTVTLDGVKIYADVDGTGRAGTANLGLFGKQDQAAALTVKNSTIDLSFTEGSGATGRNVGGIIGLLSGASTVNVIGNTINVDVTTAATLASNYAGVIGKADVDGATIYAEKNTVNFTVTDSSTEAVEHGLGGLVGYVAKVPITTKENTVTLNVTDNTTSTTSHYIGGLVANLKAGAAYTFSFNGDKVYGTATTTAGNAHCVGSIVGSATVNGKVNITGAYSAATLKSSTGNTVNIGGIVGINQNNNEGGLLTLDSCTFAGSLTGTGRTGGILAANFGYVDIDNCLSNGTVSASSNAGGVIGYDKSATREVNITNTTNSSSVSGTGNYYGGILGVINAGTTSIYNITNCLNTGALTSSKVGVGGIVGGVYNGSTVTINITRCVNRGAVKNSNTSTNYYTAGGIMGVVNNDGATVNITSCVNEGTVTGGKVSGGILGYAGAHASLAYNVTVKDCYNMGVVDGPRLGGIVGSAAYSTAVANTLTIDGCYNGATNKATTWGGGILGMACPSAPSGTVLSVVTVKNSVNNGGFTSDSVTTAGYLGAFVGCGRAFVTVSNCADYVESLSAVGTANDCTSTNFSNFDVYSCTVPEMEFVGASMRVKDTENYTSGLTFKAKVDADMIQKYIDATHPTGGYTIVKDIKVGMLVVPTHMLEDCNNIFTATSVEAAAAVEFSGDELTSLLNDEGYFYASLVGFNEDWANTEFSVITYVSYKLGDDLDWITVYGDYSADNARSIAYVASQTVGTDAYNDYTADQQAMIDTYAGLYVENN